MTSNADSDDEMTLTCVVGCNRSARAKRNGSGLVNAAHQSDRATSEVDVTLSISKKCRPPSRSNDESAERVQPWICKSPPRSRRDALARDEPSAMTLHQRRANVCAGACGIGREQQCEYTRAWGPSAHRMTSTASVRCASSCRDLDKTCATGRGPNGSTNRDRMTSPSLGVQTRRIVCLLERKLIRVLHGARNPLDTAVQVTRSRFRFSPTREPSGVRATAQINNVVALRRKG